MFAEPLSTAPEDTGPGDDSGPGGPTLADVAALAGLSTATASRVLNDSARVSDRARGLVEDAMTQLGYVRRRARYAPHPRGQAVAAVVTERSARFFSDPFFSRLLRGATRTLAEAGIQLISLSVHGQSEYAAASRYLRSGGVQGILLISAHSRDPLLLQLQAAAIPTVVSGRPLNPSTACYVDADNTGGARTAVSHLVRGGRRRVATIAGSRDMTSGIDRLAGYHEVIAEDGLAALVGYGDFTQASGEHAMTRLLERHPDLDAVFAASDLMAAGALRALRRAGRRVPEDVAVVGFDDNPIAQHTFPQLTTIRQQVEEQGEAMARRVLTLMAGGTVAQEESALPTWLVRRMSA